MASRLRELYKNEIAKAMMEKFGYKNVMEIPRVRAGEKRKEHCLERHKLIHIKRRTCCNFRA